MPCQRYQILPQRGLSMIPATIQQSVEILRCGCSDLRGSRKLESFEFSVHTSHLRLESNPASMHFAPLLPERCANKERLQKALQELGFWRHPGFLADVEKRPWPSPVVALRPHRLLGIRPDKRSVTPLLQFVFQR